MHPAIKDGDEILISNIPYLFKKPNINDIVAVKFKNKTLIKRIVKIKQSRYFLRGDNKIDSFDSRRFGFIDRKQILGKLVYKL